MNINFIGNFHEPFFSLAKREFTINNYFYQRDKISEFIQAYCEKNDINIIEINEPNDFLSYIEELGKADLNVVASFGLIIPSEVVGKIDFINVHTGILPNYRGKQPIHQAVLHREKYMGITIHIINSEGIDTGKILAFEKIEIDYERSYLDNELRLLSLSSFMIIDAVNNYKNSNYIASYDTGTYYKPLPKEEMEKFYSCSTLNECLKILKR